jgi:hypothetical protein
MDILNLHPTEIYSFFSIAFGLAILIADFRAQNKVKTTQKNGKDN